MGTSIKRLRHLVDLVAGYDDRRPHTQGCNALPSHRLEAEKFWFCLRLREKEKSTCTKVDSPKLLVLFSTKAELLTMLRSSITDVLLSATTGVVA